jgi:hypothetical protein
MTNESSPAPLGINPYFHDLLRDLLYCFRLHCADLYAGYPPELRDEMLTKADLLERWLDPIPNATERSFL